MAGEKDKIEALDFAINVIKEHEKEFDEKLKAFGDLLDSFSGLLKELIEIMESNAVILPSSARLTSAEISDVEASWREIKKGRAKKFRSVDEFLEDLKKNPTGVKMGTVLDALKDGEWHTLDEILEKANLELTKAKLMRILDFYCVHGFVDIDAVFGKVRAKPKVVAFLKRLAEMKKLE